MAQCPAGQDGETCLTPAQSAAIKKIYEGVTVDGKPAHFGQPIGAEAAGAGAVPVGRRRGGWSRWLIPARPTAAPSIRSMAKASCATSLPKSDPNLDVSKFDYAKDIAKYADARVLLNATNLDLSGLARARAARS